jgi:hypothetical protein
MMNKRIFVIVISIVLVLATVAGVIFSVIPKDSDPSAGTEETVVTVEEPETPGDSHFEHMTGNAVIEFEDENELFFDASLVTYLERMEFGVPAIDGNGNYYFDSDGDIVYDTSQEKDLEGVLDTLILLINHYAKHGYSMDASHQIQRFYVMYYNRFSELPFDELTGKISKCFPASGADAETLPGTVLEVFGFNRGDDFAFVFRPLEVAEVKVEFYNVLPASVVLSDELERDCIYDSWHNEEDDGLGYERNLEGWLHNVIKAADAAGLSEEKIIVAQILYAGSLADAQYRADWADALVRCMTVENWSYDTFKLAVEAEFGVCIDYNVPLIDYFEATRVEGKV